MWGKVFTRNFLLNKILLDLVSWVHGARIYTYLYLQLAFPANFPRWKNFACWKFPRWKSVAGNAGKMEIFLGEF